MARLVILGRHRAHYDVSVMALIIMVLTMIIGKKIILTCYLQKEFKNKFTKKETACMVSYYHLYYQAIDKNKFRQQRVNL